MREIILRRPLHFFLIRNQFIRNPGLGTWKFEETRGMESWLPKKNSQNLSIEMFIETNNSSYADWLYNCDVRINANHTLMMIILVWKWLYISDVRWIPFHMALSFWPFLEKKFSWNTSLVMIIKTGFYI